MRLELLLAVTEHVLDEVLQLPGQLQVAEGQLVRGDAEDFPERGKGPGDGRVTRRARRPNTPGSPQTAYLALAQAPAVCQALLSINTY